MKQALTFAAVAVVTGVLSYLVTYSIMCAAPQENEKRVHATVQAVCNYARTHIDGESEEACGIAQDTSETMYQCLNGICEVKELYE